MMRTAMRGRAARRKPSPGTRDLPMRERRRIALENRPSLLRPPFAIEISERRQKRFELIAVRKFVITSKHVHQRERDVAHPNEVRRDGLSAMLPERFEYVLHKARLLFFGAVHAFRRCV